MGTNYYVKSHTCECCGHKKPELHIGKASAGWTFIFQATDNINSFQEWKEYLKDKQIVDEYGREVSLDTFKALVEDKAHEKLNHTTYCLVAHPEESSTVFLDSEGHSFSRREFC